MVHPLRGSKGDTSNGIWYGCCKAVNANLQGWLLGRSVSVTRIGCPDAPMVSDPVDVSFPVRPKEPGSRVGVFSPYERLSWVVVSRLPCTWFLSCSVARLRCPRQCL